MTEKQSESEFFKDDDGECLFSVLDNLELKTRLKLEERKQEYRDKILDLLAEKDARIDWLDEVTLSDEEKWQERLKIVSEIEERIKKARQDHKGDYEEVTPE